MVAGTVAAAATGERRAPQALPAVATGEARINTLLRIGALRAEAAAAAAEERASAPTAVKWWESSLPPEKHPDLKGGGFSKLVNQGKAHINSREAFRVQQQLRQAEADRDKKKEEWKKAKREKSLDVNNKKEEFEQAESKVAGLKKELTSKIRS